MKVLVVENDRTDLFILKKTLEIKYDLVLFESTQKALEYAAANYFDIALINAHLTKYWDGVSFLTELKNCSQCSFTSIALLTEMSTNTLRLIKEAGFDIALLLPLSEQNFEISLHGKFEV